MAFQQNLQLSPIHAYNGVAQTHNDYDDDVFVLLTASKFHQVCGRGSRRNWFYIRNEAFILDPPPPLLDKK